MGCNCAASKHIEELYKHYGEKKTPSKGETFTFKVKRGLRLTGVGICMIFIAPIIFLYVFYKAFGDDDHKISVRNFFKLRGNTIGTNVG